MHDAPLLKGLQFIYSEKINQIFAHHSYNNTLYTVKRRTKTKTKTLKKKKKQKPLAVSPSLYCQPWWDWHCNKTCSYLLAIMPLNKFKLGKMAATFLFLKWQIIIFLTRWYFRNLAVFTLCVLLCGTGIGKQNVKVFSYSHSVMCAQPW